MAQIFQDQTFAVVDLETTGTQREDNHHIIQFGCALIKHGQVVKTYSYMINPHRSIPQPVQNLTGIHDEDVAKAKDFKFYAPKIIEILEGTVFVAHNVNFDLPFLNHELVQNGFSEFSGKAIDTVELAKIAFPTFPSYKLSDLTKKLAIKHKDPHKADSDAYGTAILLLKIIEKLSSLPQATLNTLSALSHGLIRDTSWVITSIATELRQKKRPLAKNWMQVRNLVLRKQANALPANEHHEATFPESDQEKRRLFKGKLNYRREQVNLIDHLEKFIQDPDQRAMLIEAPNGTGKTFSYLFSYAYNLYSGRKLVIAAPTKVLQDQLIQREIPQLLKVTGLDLTFEAVKSSYHYIDLDGFMQTLYQGGNHNIQTLVLQMQIIVWLTETTTGDLDELELTNYQAPLFAKITHPGDARVGSTFAEVDFWNLARQHQEQADILVTNHAYLANHFNDSIWGPNPYLVIDEAHRFADNVISSRNDALQFESLWGQISHLRNLLFFSNYAQIFNDNPQMEFLLNHLDQDSRDLIHEINHLQRWLYQKRPHALSREVDSSGEKYVFEGATLFPAENEFISQLTSFCQKMEQVRQETNEISYQLFAQKEDRLSEDLVEVIDHLDFYIEQSYQLSDLIADKTKLEHEGFVVQVTNSEDPLSSNLHWLMVDASEVLPKIYDRFDHLAFVSATMTSDRNFDYIKRQLCLNHLMPTEYIGKSTFNYEQHLAVITVSDLPNPESEDYPHELAKVLLSTISDQGHVLVLMTNLAKIKELYSEIANEPVLADYELLAQGISGSNSRIAKRFAIASQAIILGADSFWEGIDFHDCGIDLVFATKLPFESPDQPEVRLRQQQLQSQGYNIFKYDSLPRAILRFRQGMGRLIRGEEDHGQFVILDNRIWQKEYGRDFLKVIPVKAKKIKVKDLKGTIDRYE
ncbi:helicase C-terminal domain-containing protein [Lactobacillus corticis]|uniref:3'-5' exonuclease DinG n=1 Tax=Lactobacillus corticis TaxID=2201249 RepID=A0A916VJ45_9LACO|nr:helicase C-terminal domain-containing protein [Lactobacillus corticis]GFZ27029.1 ATP-dependent helicase [Lactobacillus corticis]